MNHFTLVLMLALLWAAMTEELTVSNLAIGFFLGYVTLVASQRVVGAGRFVQRLPRLLSLLIFFAKEITVANLRVAYDVITPRYHMKPGVVAVPLDAQTDLEIAWVANFISLTPGSLSLDVSSDRKVLYIYTMFIDDRDALVHEIKNGLERRILEVLR